MPCTSAFDDRITAAERLWLFLDYDGTLADFAPTPDHVEPDSAVAALLARLAAHPRIRVSVISGRRLAHVQKLIPVPGVLLAGTYGVELQTESGDRLDRVPYETIRPPLDILKPRWAALIARREGFFLEDKGWALALHARFAADSEAGAILDQARRAADEEIPPEPFRILGGHKFLEVGPRLAHKGRTVEYLLERFPLPGALLVYLGDDDKDEEAFAVVKAHDGLAVLVASDSRDTLADCRLGSPADAREWLAALPDLMAG
jgi:trehalose 6-phosphate phosphatase